MKIISKTAAPLFFIFLISACENFWEPRSVVTNLPEHEPVLVINSFIHPDSVFEVSVSKSRGFLEPREYPFIRNATVEILESGNPIAQLLHTHDGIYRALVEKPTIGTAYELNVSADGFRPVTATTSIPVPIRIDSVDMALDNTGRFEIDVTVYFQDPANEDNYYQLIIFSRDTFDGHTFVQQIGFSSSDAVLRKPDDFEDKSYYYTDAFFDDALFDGDFYDLDISYDYYYQDSDELLLLLLTTPESYYNFLKSAEQQEETEGNPFAEPTLIFTNIEGGLGIFAAYSSFTYRLK